MVELKMALQQFERIGADRCQELSDVRPRSTFAERAWAVYESEFGGCTGATRDAAFRRLDHPAHRIGRPMSHADTSVLVVGTGPSLADGAVALRRQRSTLVIVTSLRGARALQDLDIVPDLVVLSEASPLEAALTLVNSRVAGSIEQLGEVPLVAADERTPAELLCDVGADRLFIPSYCPSWTWWPAAAVAMAVDGGARRVGMLGIDLGSLDGVDPAFQPLLALVELLATLPGVEFVDCGRGGAPKSGWAPSGLDAFARGGTNGRFELDAHPRPSSFARWSEECETLDHVRVAIAGVRRQYETRAALADAAWEPAALNAMCHEVLQWRERPWLRRVLQERLGLVFLPTFWRMGEFGRGARGLALALAELFEQTARLEAKLEAVWAAAEVA